MKSKTAVPSAAVTRTRPRSTATCFLMPHGPSTRGHGQSHGATQRCPRPLGAVCWNELTACEPEALHAALPHVQRDLLYACLRPAIKFESRPRGDTNAGKALVYLIQPEGSRRHLYSGQEWLGVVDKDAYTFTHVAPRRALHMGRRRPHLRRRVLRGGQHELRGDRRQGHHHPEPRTG